MSHIRLAAPLATADGAAISDDDRLVASVFVVEQPTTAQASQLMEADPYTTRGIWQCISLFTVEDPSGNWLSLETSDESPQRTYAAFSSDDTVRRNSVFGNSILFTARLRLAQSLGDAALQREWRSLIIFGSQSLDSARSTVAQAPRSPDSPPDETWAVPLAAGSWPGKTRL